MKLWLDSQLDFRNLSGRLGSRAVSVVGAGAEVGRGHTPGTPTSRESHRCDVQWSTGWAWPFRVHREGQRGRNVGFDLKKTWESAQLHHFLAL